MDQEAYFTYVPLALPSQNLRLLTLLPVSNSSNGEINCELQAAPSVAAVCHTYETISYVWGSRAYQVHILINDKVFEVTANVRKLLLRLRHLTESRILWIDTICIDQCNTSEKEHHLTLMSKIYRYGSRNVVGLEHNGSDNNKQACDLAVETMRRMREIEVPSILEVNPETEEMKAIDVLLANPWFHMRLWVVQEAVLPRDHICIYGQGEFSLHELEDVSLRTHTAANWTNLRITLSKLFSPEATQGLRILTNFWILHREYAWLHHTDEEPQPRDLAVLLQTNLTREATDPHDHVYGLLGLLESQIAGQPLPSGLLPDYTIPLHVLYRSATRVAINSRQDLHALRIVYHDTEGLLDLKGFPSWVARLDLMGSAIERPARPGFWHCAHFEFMSDKHAEQSPDPDVLTWQGTVLDEVTKTTAVMRDNMLHEKETLLLSLDEIDHLALEAASSARSPLDTAYSLEECVAETLIGGECHRAAATREDIRQGYKFRKALVSAKALDDLDGDALSYRLLLSVCRRKRFFITSSGRIGLGDPATQQGDMVAILYNCAWPLILRKLDTDSSYNFVGIAYVNGAMQGEAMKAHIEESRADAVFHIH
ncbi:hypothetical protein LTS10_000602 [Elasticomyces elasticus]|nr:hypothetical protein LTS10_000602 [Elasticomyces elasticus]